MNQILKRRIPAYLPFMAILTAAYLTVEVPFSVHLVDVLGGNPSADDIHAIERFGRVLTGCAVAIAVMGWMLARAYRKADFDQRFSRFPRGLPLAVLVGALCVGGTYVLLDRIAVGIADGSDGIERKRAMSAVLARQALATAPGDTFRSDANDPAFKAFLSIAPILGRDGELMSISRVDKAPIVADEAARRVGSVADFRSKVFGKSFASVDEAYKRYEDGSAAYRDARNGVERRISAAWGDYMDQRHSTRTVPIRDRNQMDTIRNRVISRGIPVPANWHPDDRRGFEAALRGKLVKDVDANYISGIEAHLGKGAMIQPGLGYDAFLAEAPVQRLIRKNLGISGGGTVIRPAMNDAQFVEAVYRPAIASMTREISDSMTASAVEFLDGRRFAEMGRGAAQSASIPAMAIMLSLAGAFLHICKISGFLAQMVGYATSWTALRWSVSKWVVGSAVAASVGFAMLAPANAVTSSDTYAKLASSSGSMSTLIGFSIAIQPGFQPVGRTLGAIGGWRLVVGSLPEAKPTTVAPRPKAKPAVAGIPAS